jgi:hypothetical protein
MRVALGACETNFGERFEAAQQRQLARIDHQPQRGFVLEESLHGAVEHRVLIFGARHDHVAQRIVAHYDVRAESGDHALAAIKQPGHALPFRDHNHARTPFRHDRREIKARVEDGPFGFDAAHEGSERGDLFARENDRRGPSSGNGRRARRRLLVLEQVELVRFAQQSVPYLGANAR